MSHEFDRFPEVDGSVFGDFTPVTTYIFYDFPRAFTLRGTDGCQYFAYNVDDNADSGWFIVVKVSDGLAELISQDLITLRDIIRRDPMYVVQFKNHCDKAVIRAVPSFIVIRDEYLPKQGVYLGINNGTC